MCRGSHAFSFFGLVCFVGLGIALFGVGGCRWASAERVLDADLAVSTDRPQTLVSRFQHGDMQVHGGPDGWHLRATVTVWASTQATADAIAADLVVVVEPEEGDRLRVLIRPVSDGWDADDYRLGIQSWFRVPHTTGVDVATTHGRLIIEDLEGNVVGRTTHGAIEVRDLVGAVDCRTTHGDITAEDIAGSKHRFATTFGDATLRDVSGTVDVRTTHGGITADLGSLRRGESRLATTHGSIVCRLAADSDVTIAAHTSHGSVRCEIPGAHSQLDGSSGKVILGQGSGSLTIRTSHGRVRIEESARRGRLRTR